MEKTKNSIALLLLLLPLTGMAESATKEKEEGKAPLPMRYFVGLKGGLSQISNSDRVVLASGETIDASTTNSEGFAGLDVGIYTPGGQSRLYYSFERHSSESRFSDMTAYDTDANLHLFSADYLFRHQEVVTPFVGLHVGYASIEADSRFSDHFKVNGMVFGLQAGIGWRVMDQLGLELGMRHTVLPSGIETWTGEDKNGNRVTFASQENGVTSYFVSVNYRY